MAAARSSTGHPGRHQQMIEILAKENDSSIDHVRELFEAAHSQLESEAKIKTYVSVIAVRLVRNVLLAERDAQDH